MFIKKFIAIISAFALFSVSAISAITVSAEETKTTYTFEELLLMSEDEITAISEDYSLALTSAKKFYDVSVTQNPDEFPFHIAFYNDTYTSTDEKGIKSYNSEKMCTDLGLPKQLAKLEFSMHVLNMPNDENKYQVYTFTLFPQEYNGYSSYDVSIKALTAIIASPNVVSFNNLFFIPAGAANPEYTTPITTTATTETTTEIITTLIDTTTTTVADTTITQTEQTTNAQTTAMNTTTKKADTTTKAKKSDKDSPKTGDNGISAVLSVAVLAFAGCVASKKKKDN